MSEPQEVNIQTVEEQAPELAKALGTLELSLNKFNELQAEILPQQQKGLVIPNVAQRIHIAQKNIAKALDNTQLLMRKHQKNEAVMAVAMGAYQEGMLYMQGIVFGIHYSRVSSKHANPFQRMLAESYHMLERQQKRG